MSSSHPFIGRDAEFQRLKDLRKKGSASLIVIRGRRRIGKSRLAEEFGKLFPRAYFFTGLPPTEETSAQAQRDEFVRQMATQALPSNKNKDWGDLFFDLAKGCQKKEVLVVLDEVTWMGSKDPLFLGKLKIAWDSYFKKNSKLILIISGSNSSWIEKNILSSTGFFGRISLRLHLKELSLSECNNFWNGKISPYEKFKILSITGGVPRYLEEVSPKFTSEENIRRLCFSEDGILFSEFENIFSDLFYKRNEHFKALVLTLATGSKTIQEIAKALKRTKGGDLTSDLNQLVEGGFISRDFAWSIKSGKASKLSQYRLSDNYLRFYLKFIKPYRKSIMDQGSIPLPGNWESILGLQFENLVLSNVKTLIKILKIPPEELLCSGRFFQTATSQRKGCQIDLLIQTRHGVLFVCEVKFQKGEVSESVISEVEEKIKHLQIPKHTSIRSVLIHVNGVSSKVGLSDYFSNIIDFSDLLS